MATHSGKNGLVACPNNHPNAHDAVDCDTCGLPIIRFEAELDVLLRTLAEERLHLGSAPEKLFIGVGEQGCRLVRDFHGAWGGVQPGFAFLMIDSATDARYASRAGESDQPSGEAAASPLTLYLIPSPDGAQKGYYALGERLAAGDPKIDDCLRRSGIRATSGNQSVFLLSALGGATGSGASPNILHRAKASNPLLRSIVTTTVRPIPFQWRIFGNAPEHNLGLRVQPKDFAQLIAVVCQCPVFPVLQTQDLVGVQGDDRTFERLRPGIGVIDNWNVLRKLNRILLYLS